MTYRKYKLIIPAIAAVVAQLVAPTLVQVAYAAPQFTQTFVRPDRHLALTATGTLVCATPTTASTEAEVKITFPTVGTGTDFVVNSTAANWDVDFVNMPAGATNWPITGTEATNVTGKTVTFATSDLTAATQYCFHISGTNTLTNSSAAQSSNIVDATLWTEDSSDVMINQTNWSTAVIANDQILVTAVVPPNFSLTLDGATDAFSDNLDPNQMISTGGRTVSITTNAVGGWITWVKSATITGEPGLHSATANYTIESGLKDTSLAHLHLVGAAAFDLVAGQEGYVLDTDVTTDGAGGCTVAADAAYNSVSDDGGGRLAEDFRPMANCTGAAPATSDGDVLTLYERATIRGGTPAGSDYSDTLTIVGAGNF